MLATMGRFTRAMMRRGPLADNPIEALLDAAASERTSGIIELHTRIEGAVYLAEGEIYLAEVEGQPPLEERLVAAGVLTRSQVEAHTEPGDDGMYLALALDTDETIDEHAIGAYLLELTASTVARFVGVNEGEYELDPYGTHPDGILVSWSPAQVFDRVRALRAEAERLEVERAEAERIEAEQIEAGQAEAARLEAERLAAEQIEAERVEAERADQHAGGENESADVEVEPIVEATADGEALPAPPAGSPLDAVSMLVVTPDEPPKGLDPIQLRPIEWRIIVLAAEGTSLSDLARRLSLEGDLVRDLVADLCDRGLLATVG